MSEIDNILSQIESLKRNLDNLITQKDSLLDPEIIIASQMLDSMLNKYSKIIKEKMDK
ncbi:aspartyl-phosphate phosphatase Spo0E family protein [Clostridium sp. BJN0013]|uniref:aspartyl-phosphate phosphatase Spo0E family protein n=1 Tax=Clostridium sp. BJN0013 TaxID=3236840 RepID=UPI0034C6ACEE